MRHELAAANRYYFTDKEGMGYDFEAGRRGKRIYLTDDEELDAFLFSLGCYSDEPITVVSHLKGGCIVSVKDSRYNIDNQLAEAIVLYE